MEKGLDTLTSLAPLLQVRPQLQQICRFRGGWSSPHEPEEPGWAPFHLVTQGICRLETPGHAMIELTAGDVALLPHGSRHRLASATPTDAASPIRIEPRRHAELVLKTNVGASGDTGLVCGRLRFEQASSNLVLAALPEIIVIRSTDGPDARRIRDYIGIIREELEDDRLGAAAIGTQLASALMLIVLRAHLESGAAQRGVLALLANRQTAKVVAAITGDPARDWSLDELAERAGASRTTLVRLFQKSAGMAPSAFVTEFRLALARRHLRATGRPVGQVAADVGYQSDAAFNRAYLRRFGVSPGLDRRPSLGQAERRAPAMMP